MIAPIIAAQTSAPIASIQQNADAAGVLQTHNASKEVKETERQIREDVTAKEDGVFYEHQPDAREQGSNTYSDMFRKKKKKPDGESGESDKQVRQNFDLRI